MKINKMMRLASVLLVAVLLSTCAIFSTFAKYVTTYTDSNSARVARWGFNETKFEIEDLFAAAYDGSVQSENGSDKVIAPGTKGSTKISFAPQGGVAPEVAYSITVTATTSVNVATNTICNNGNIKWALYKEGTAENEIVWGDFSTLLTSIQGLSEASVEENALPKLNANYVIAWMWDFNNVAEADNPQNETDTAMGNASPLEAIDLTITITATQLD